MKRTNPQDFPWRNVFYCCLFFLLASLVNTSSMPPLPLPELPALFSPMLSLLLDLFVISSVKRRLELLKPATQLPLCLLPPCAARYSPSGSLHIFCHLHSLKVCVLHSNRPTCLSFQTSRLLLRFAWAVWVIDVCSSKCKKNKACFAREQIAELQLRNSLFNTCFSRADTNSEEGFFHL